ncbi:Bug family tripartite tricarboxylate transporter substrate binding protein [Paralcaligenes ginsengisoli]
MLFIKKTITAGFAVSMLLVTGATANAADFPDHAIQLVVPWAPGGATDVIGRFIAKGLSERIGQAVVVNNKAGAGGNIGTTSFVREKPDGYTLLVVTSSTNAANPHLYSHLGFDPKKDFAPIAYIGSIPNVLEVPKGSPFNSVGDLLIYAKEHPNKLNYGSAGVGSSQHLASSLLVHLTGIKVTHIPYKGSGPAVSDLLGKQLDFMIDTGSISQVKAGTLKALAVASKTRLTELPDVPTFAEAGVKDMYASAWYGIAAPAGTPVKIVDELNKKINLVLKDPDINKKLEAMGVQVGPAQSPKEFAGFMSSELSRYGELVKLSGAKMD